MQIKLENVTKEIHGVRVLDDISYVFQDGKIYGFSGKNGSGKTMLMRVLCGLIYATSGTVTIGDKVLGRDISFPPSIGVLIENPSFISKYTGLKNLKLLASIRNNITEEDIRNMMQKVDLNPDDKRTYHKYSLGMKQRLGIACALMENSEIILLDEPINAIDESGVELVKNLLLERKKQGSIIIISCHDKEELELLSDEIIYLSEGHIVSDNQSTSRVHTIKEVT